jgi:ribose-phosphate pyrophosphokinase
MKTIMCCPEMNEIVEGISSYYYKSYSTSFGPVPVLNSLLRLPDIETVTSISNIQWYKFPDGNPNNMFEEPETIKGSDVFFIADFENTEKIFNYLSVIYAIPHNGAKSLTVFVPYFSTATMERVGRPGQIATAKTLMRQLNIIPPCHGSGPARVIVFDIHALAVQHFHDDGIIVELQSALPLLFQEIQRLQKDPHSTLYGKKIAFAFPDEGSRKRFHYFFPDPCIICTKDEDRKVTIKEGHKLVDERHVIIIDDMIRQGDTLLSCASALKHYGASAVSAYATHGAFPQESWKKFYESKITNLWVTDSCKASRDLDLSTRHLSKPSPFKFLSLASLIAEEIKKS